MKWPERHALDPHAEFYSAALHTLVGRFSARLMCVWRIANIVLVVMALVVLTWCIWQVMDRAPPVDAAAPQPINLSARPGGVLKVHFDLVRYRVCALDINSLVFDGADEPHDLVSIHRDVSGPLGRDHFTRSFPVPEDAKPGQARLRITWSYICPGNYLQVLSPIPLAFPDIPFTITPP